MGGPRTFGRGHDPAGVHRIFFYALVSARIRAERGAHDCGLRGNDRLCPRGRPGHAASRSICYRHAVLVDEHGNVSERQMESPEFVAGTVLSIHGLRNACQGPGSAVPALSSPFKPCAGVIPGGVPRVLAFRTQRVHAGPSRTISPFPSCFLSPGFLASYLSTNACVPCVIAAPARRAAATTTASAIS